MNIASTTALSSPTAAPATRPDVLGTGHIVAHADDGLDQGSPVRGFGVMLTKHLDDAASGDASGKAGPRGDPGTKLQAGANGTGTVDAPDLSAAVTAADPAATAAGAATTTTTSTATTTVPRTSADGSSGAAPVTPQVLFPTLAASSTTTSGSSSASIDGKARKSQPDDDRVPAGDPGSDLAAQLALASQWAGVAKPVDPATVAPQGPPSTAAAAVAVSVTSSVIGAGTPDVKAASGKDRASSAKTDASDTTGARTVATPNEAKHGTPVASVSTAPSTDDPRQGDAHGAPTGNASLVAAKDDAKARESTAVAALDAAGAVPAQTHAIPDGDAFAVRLATHVSGVQAPITTPTAATAAAASPMDALREPVGTPAWSHEVGQATLRMAANDLQSASIRLNPEHLGPLDVQVRVDNGVAHLAFNAAHVDTRQALEASRGTLDQLFTSQGLKMGDVSVGSGSSSSSGSSDASAARGDPAAGGSRRDGGRWSGNDTGTDADASVKTVTTRIARALGLVDTFA